MKFQPHQLYHVYNRGNDQKPIFYEQENYFFFLKKMRRQLCPFADIFAYCLMPNHLHLMVRINEASDIENYALKCEKDLSDLQGFENLGGLRGLFHGHARFVSQQFSNLFNSYTKSFNKLFGRKGSLFIPNFRRKSVEDDEYLAKLIVYIHNNPVHHRFCNSAFEWEFSSLRAYRSKSASSVNVEEGWSFFDDQKSFIDLHRTLNIEEITSELE